MSAILFKQLAAYPHPLARPYREFRSRALFAGWLRLWCFSYLRLFCSCAAIQTGMFLERLYFYSRLAFPYLVNSCVARKE